MAFPVVCILLIFFLTVFKSQEHLEVLSPLHSIKCAFLNSYSVYQDAEFNNLIEASKYESGAILDQG